MLRLIAVLSCLLALPAVASAAEDIPAHLPRYDLTVQLNTHDSVADVKQRTTWTNNSQATTKKLVLNFYPRYEIPRGDYLLLAKTLEMLRLNPDEGIDERGGHGTINSIRYMDASAGKWQQLGYSYRKDNLCALSVELPQEVQPGESVTIDIDCSIKLPNKQGRWGHWNGINYLTFALPTLAYHDTAGWHDVPFVPWHQPFWNEAGIYTAKVQLPEEQELVTPAVVDSVAKLKGGWKEVRLKPFVGRDFAILSSAKYKTRSTTVRIAGDRVVTINCHCTQQHVEYAEKMLQIAANAIETYSKWFGPYPYDQFTIAESYFGWNGNECAGLVMIDERVFDMPHLGRGYVEYLLSHETSHQWWYNMIGTNGYSETFMDEGPAVYFTHRMLDKQRGRNNGFLKWPDQLGFAPNILRENYRYGPFASVVRRHEIPPAAGQLPEFGNLFVLFSGAYDRGSKFFGIIEDRLGEEAFFDFIRMTMQKYRFRVISSAMLKKDLEEYTGKNWDEVYDRWVYGRGLTDWAIDSVTIDGEHPRGPLGWRMRRNFVPRPPPNRVEVVIKQHGEYDERTVVGFQFEEGDGYPVRIPIGPINVPRDIPEYNARVIPINKDTIKVSLQLDRPPINIQIDPDAVLLDANPGNNSWARSPRVKFTPLYNIASETDLTADHDRWNFTFGPWLWSALYQDPWYTRSTMFGLRAGAFRTQEFQGGVYGAFRTDYRDVVAGVDGLVDHWPWPKTQIGFNYERRVAGPFFGTNGEETANRAYIFGRYVLRPTSSMYLPPMHYVEAFTSYTDNFLPIAREGVENSVRPSWTWLAGAHYRVNLYTPYWDPTRGAWVDLSFGAGVTKLEETVGTQQIRGELALARKLPDGLGWMSDVRLAARVAGAAGFPNRGQYFTLGGSTQFRGFDLSERQGSAMWLASAEARLPVIREARYNILDSIAGLRNLYVAPFYDVGAAYTRGDVVTNVAHALGVGLRADIAIFSFIERATVRFDVAKTVNAASPFQFWFGVLHPF